jgi:hypothetical protein
MQTEAHKSRDTLLSDILSYVKSEDQRISI